MSDGAFAALVLLAILAGCAIAVLVTLKVIDRVRRRADRRLAKGWLNKAAHNDRDFRCQYWTGDRSGGIGLDREICKVCRNHDEEDT